jgi:hypothetical protein
VILQEYQEQLAALTFGKQLPNALYVYWEEDNNLGEVLNILIAKLAARHQLGREFNVIKFRTDELKISFLSYPEFMEEAHPGLRQAGNIPPCESPAAWRIRRPHTRGRNVRIV